MYFSSLQRCFYCSKTWIIIYHTEKVHIKRNPGLLFVCMSVLSIDQVHCMEVRKSVTIHGNADAAASCHCCLRCYYFGSFIVSTISDSWTFRNANDTFCKYAHYTKIYSYLLHHICNKVIAAYANTQHRWTCVNNYRNAYSKKKPKNIDIMSIEIESCCTRTQENCNGSI